MLAFTLYSACGNNKNSNSSQSPQTGRPHPEVQRVMSINTNSIIPGIWAPVADGQYANYNYQYNSSQNFNDSYHYGPKIQSYIIINNDSITHVVACNSVQGKFYAAATSRAYVNQNEIEIFGTSSDQQFLDGITCTANISVTNSFFYHFNQQGELILLEDFGHLATVFRRVPNI